MLKLTEKQRNIQIKKEATASVILYLCFFLWWYFMGYGLAGRTDPADYIYIMGLPLWFFMSCIVGFVLLCVATILLVTFYFKHFSLDETEDEPQEQIIEEVT